MTFHLVTDADIAATAPTEVQLQAAIAAVCALEGPPCGALLWDDPRLPCDRPVGHISGHWWDIRGHEFARPE